MNLFRETKNLTKQYEDHLTCFLAAALEVDGDFRKAYESIVLKPMAKDKIIPCIKEVKIQQSFEFRINNDKKTGRLDMILVLDDNRIIGCEHKIDAPETQLDIGDGKILFQIDKYLKIRELAAIAYFRPSNCQLNDDMLSAKTSWTVFVPGHRGHSRLINAVCNEIPRPGFYPGRALIFVLSHLR